MSTIGQVMKKLDPLKASMSRGEALAALQATGLNYMPVVDKNFKLLGLVSPTDLQLDEPETSLVK